MSNKEDSKSEETASLTAAQRARVERNRQKALLLKQARLSSQPYTRDGHKVKAPNKTIDTGAGFFIDEDEEKKIHREVTQQPGPILPQISDHLMCEECSQPYMESYLQNHFNVSVCDKCKEEDKYELITKTDAKNKYLLKDEDFDVREPILKFILRKNPHNPRWGDMKLFLELQVKARALEVWGEEDKIEEAQEQRAVNREKSKKKKFDKRVKELRMAVRSSLWRKEISGHEHDYGEETYDEDSDEYSKTCKTCGHVLTYEKM
ncbi:DNA repair protein complementing XP-A cells homolog [Littorina saxatilis]|uniref:XPA C-terminal domain-containing protein n=1 Tax=Littorina saxatilis TaxID=31220 RepID=A0AAN9C361_9CAEN